ncbi:histone acetyltransferase 1, partial [Peltigera leucophlebia]|nr:histone acetyltransferase 1 [Peltigera leucophlebia]
KHHFVPTSKLLDVSLLDSLRHKNKLAPRQWARLVELYLLSLIAPYKRQAGVARLTQRGKTKDDDDRAFYYWRLLVKQRVYKQNRDLLIQLNRGERIDKVEQTVGEIAGDCERLLRNLEKRKDLDDLLTSTSNGNEEGMEDPAPRERKRGLVKRKVIVIDDDDDDDDAVEIDAAEGERAVKRRKESNV